MTQTYTVRRDDARDIRFTGALIASTRNFDDRAYGDDWSGQTGRWQSYFLYQTKAGKYVCQAIHHTRWQGEVDQYTAEVCETADEVAEFFGHSRWAREIYDEAGLDVVEEVA
jgi:hypothetical protein